MAVYDLTEKVWNFRFGILGEGVRQESHASYPRRTAAFHFASPPSCTYSLTYCLQPLTQNGEIRHSNTYGEVNVFKSVAAHVYLHKCIARFVSDI